MTIQVSESSCDEDERADGKGKGLVNVSRLAHYD